MGIHKYNRANVWGVHKSKWVGEKTVKPFAAENEVAVIML